MIRVDTLELLALTASLSGFPKKTELTSWVLCGITGKPKLRSSFEGDWNNYVASWCCYETEFCLTWFRRVLRDEGYENGWFVPNDHFVESMESYWERRRGWGQHRIFGVQAHIMCLCSVLHTIKQIGRDTDESMLLPCFDYVTSAWMAWSDHLTKASCPIWLVVAFQILVDTGERLGSYSPTSFDDLKEQAESWIALIRRDLRHASTKRSERMDEDGMPRVYSDIPAITKCILRSDSFKRIQKTAGRPYNSKSTVSTDGIFHRFLNHHPLLCGIQSWWLEQEYRQFESWAVKIHESIAPAAFLYISMRRLDLVAQWPDMEFVSQWPCHCSPPLPLSER